MIGTIARAWDMERTGNQIQKHLIGLIPFGYFSTREGNLIFFWPKGADTTDLSNFRVADDSESSKRMVDEVCNQELSALGLHVLEPVGSTTIEHLVQSIGRLLGMGRISIESKDRAKAAIERLVKIGRASEGKGKIRALRFPVRRWSSTV